MGYEPSEKEKKLLNLLKERTDYRDGIVFIMLASKRYELIDELLDFIQQNPDATGDELFELAEDLVSDAQEEREE